MNKIHLKSINGQRRCHWITWVRLTYAFKSGAVSVASGFGDFTVAFSAARAGVVARITGVPDSLGVPALGVFALGIEVAITPGVWELDLGRTGAVALPREGRDRRGPVFIVKGSQEPNKQLQLLPPSHSRRNQAGTMPPQPTSEKALSAILPSIEAGQAYEAHQKARTFASRFAKTKHYDVAIDVLYQSAKAMFKAQQPGSGTDLGVFMLEVYVLKEEDVTDEARCQSPLVYLPT